MYSTEELEKTREDFYEAQDAMYADYYELTGIKLPIENSMAIAHLDQDKLNETFLELAKKYNYYEALEAYNDCYRAYDNFLRSESFMMQTVFACFFN